MSTPLSDEQHAAIRARHDAYRASHSHMNGFACCKAHASADDVPVLLAEVDRLRAEIDRLAADRHRWMYRYYEESRTYWDAELPPGGECCADCGQPVESEPCPEHHPVTVADRLRAELATAKRQAEAAHCRLHHIEARVEQIDKGDDPVGVGLDLIPWLDGPLHPDHLAAYRAARES